MHNGILYDKKIQRIRPVDICQTGFWRLESFLHSAGAPVQADKTLTIDVPKIHFYLIFADLETRQPEQYLGQKIV